MQRTSALFAIIPLILDWVLLLAAMGNPLTKGGIIESVHSHCLSDFKTKRQKER
jgi:hypothetical protein